MSNKFKQGFAKLMPLSMIAVMVSSLFIFFAVQQNSVTPVFAAQTATAWEYEDSDNNGTVDRVKITFDENVTACAYESGDWSFPAAGTINITGTSGITGNCNNTDAFIYLTVTGTSGNTTGGATAPTITYADNGTAGSITTVGGAINTFTASTVTDKADPIIITSSLIYYDDSNDGSTETIEMDFSENVTWNGSEPNQFGISNNNLTNFDANSEPDSFIGSTTSTFTFTTSGTTDLTGVNGGTEPQIDHVTPGGTPATNNVFDIAGNPLVNIGMTTITDEAEPVLVSAETTSHNGMDLVFSENISATGLAGTDLSTHSGANAMDGVSGGGGSTITWTTSTASEYWNSDATGSSAGTGTDETGTARTNVPNLTIATDAFTDTATPANGVFGVTNDNMTTDGAAPAVIELNYEDDNSDGTVDGIFVMFSEDLDDDIASMASSDFTVTINGATTGQGAAEMVETLDTDVADDDELIIDFTNGITDSTNEDYELAIAGSKVGDVGNNLMSAMSATDADDGAMPILLSFTSTEADATYGPADNINLTATYTENISSGSITVNLNNTVVGETLSTISTNTLTTDYTVGATGSGEDVTGLDVSSITAHSASDGTNVNSSTGMPSTTITTASSINVDTTAPTPTVTVDSDPIYEGDLDQVVTITYNESMDNGTTPTVDFTTNANWSTGGGVWSSGAHTNNIYTVTYTHDGTAENIAAETATVGAVSGATDVAGNTDNQGVSGGFGLDTEDPVATIDSAPTPTNGTQVITFTATDIGGSGVASTECSVDGATFTACTSGDAYSTLGGWGAIGEVGFTLTLRVTDNAGNVNEDTDATLTKDTVDPVPTITSAPTPTNGTQVINFTATDTGGSGVASTECSVDGATFTACSDGDAYSTLGGWGATGEGGFTLTLRVTDNADNTDDDTDATLTKDTIAPFGYSVTFDQPRYNASQQTAVSFTFAGAEVGADYNYSIDDTNGGTPAVTGSGTIATATDNISGIDVSGLDDDTLTLTAYLTDPATNQGGNAQNTAIKDTVDPTLVSFTSTTADNTYGPGSVINITATYDETLNGGGTIVVRLDNWAPNVTLNTPGGGPTAVGSYTVGVTGSGEDSSDLYVDSIISENIPDLAGNIQTGSSVPGSPNNIDDTSDIVIDTTALVITSIVADSDTNLSITMNGAVGGVTFGGAASWTATGITSTGAALDGTDIDLTVNSLGNTAFTALDFAFAITHGGEILDAVGNATSSFGPETVHDGQAPLFVSSEVDDMDSNGTIDQATITYSETVVITDGNAGDAFPGISFNNGCSAINADYASGGTTTSVITLTGCNAGANTPTVTYATAGDSIHDTVPIEMPDGEFVVSTDASKPVPLSATFYDADGNFDGKIDSITVIWSKTINDVADGSADWAISSAADFANLVEVSVNCNHPPISGPTECIYDFTTTTEKTDVGDLTLAYTGSSVTDGTNAADHVTFTSASSPAFTDGAAPVVKSTTITLYDVAGGDGIADQLIATYTEPLVDGADTPGDWAVTTNDHDSGGACTVDDADPAVSDSLTINMTCDTAYGDVGDMSVVFTNSGVFEDAAGNTVPNKIYDAASTPPIESGLIPGALTNADVELSSYWKSGDVAATITFTNEKPIPNNGKIVVIFPAGYDLSGVNNASSPDTSVDGAFAVGVVGQTVTVTRSGGSQTAATTDVTLKLTTVKNPSSAGTTGTYTFETQTAGGSTLDEDTAVPGDTITDPDSGGDTGGSTGGTGGGGGGGGGQTSSDSNTRTSSIASEIETVEGNLSYGRAVQFPEEDIVVDEDNNTASIEATGDNGTLTIKPNSGSSISLTVPSDTTVTGESNWTGRIDPPLIRSLTNIHPSGEEVIGSDDLLERADVAVLVEVGGNTPLQFSNEITLRIPVDLPEGSVVNIYTSGNGDTWISQGTAVVVDGYLVIMTDHLTYFAAEMTDETASAVEGLEDVGAFTDTIGHWAEMYIEEIADMSIVSGKSAGIFAPNDQITRGELTKIATKAYGISIDPVATYSPFGDVATSAWYTPYIVAAKESGIVSGYEGNIFSPNGMVNRAEALKILLGAAGLDTAESLADFPDVSADAWFASYVGYAQINSIVGGYPDGTFGPGNNITRAEVAKIVVKIMSMQ